MDEGKIVSCDAVDRLRKHLQQYDSCIMTCGAVPPGLQRQIGEHPDIVSCTFENGRIEFSAEHLERVLYDVLRALRTRQIDVYAIETNEPTLEDVFLNTVPSQGDG
jgi:hypothetical protein